MTKPTNAQRAEWAAKLRASGFEDLESPSGTLSARGTIGTGGSRADANGIRTHVPARPEDIADGEAYRDLVRASLHTRHFRTLQDRNVWALHGDGISYADIAAQVGISFRQVRQTIKRIKTAIKTEATMDGSLVRSGRASARRKLDRFVRALDVDLLVTLVGGLA